MNANYQRVVESLPAPTGDEWTRPTAVAEVLDMNLKTVRDHLRKAVKAGHVETENDADGLVIYRQSAAWLAQGEPAADVEPVTAEEPAAVTPTGVEFDPIEEPAETAVEPPSEPTPTEVPADGGSGASDELSAVLGAMESDRPGVTAALAALPEPGPVKGWCTHKGCNKPVTKAGRAWTHDDAAVNDAHKATTRNPRRALVPAKGTCSVCDGAVTKDGRVWTHDNPTADNTGHTPTTRKVAERSGSQNRLFNPGELKGKALGFLQDEYNKDPAQSFTIKAVAEATGASVSSAAYALSLLTEDGNVRVTGVKPYLYRAE